MDIQPEPDTKDWTWVLEAKCPECGFDARALSRADLASVARDLGDRWVAAMSAIDAPRQRPAPAVWSPLEYSCHVRDVFELFGDRLQLMLDEDDPTFENWDQDETALADDYAGQDPDVVTADLAASAEEFAAIVDTVADDAWERPGLRTNGSRFTVDSLVRYQLHDVVHHLTDITGVRWG